MSRSGDSYTFVTRGDSNTGVEQWSINTGGTLGTLALCLPRAGYLLAWIGTEKAQGGLLALITVVSAAALLRWAWGPGQRQGLPRRAPLVAWRHALVAGVVVAVVGFAIWDSAGTAWANFTATTNTTGSVATATLAAPTSLTTSLGLGKVNLSWQATTSSFASGTLVFRATASGGPYTQVAQIAGLSTTTYADGPGLGTFYYVVKANYSANGAHWTSSASNQASALCALACL
jgi:hypothetical protein